ncbi:MULTISPECIES: hypothetical protein [Chitinophaga]|uniref:hypothetical protein n=1 Tax=Chitinophaga TaxID=79328 RepID=UPI000DB976B4|nr:hypothetical protein [Chitinophaga ginsengisegetis]MDR6568390.1 hypothetical protein [Chitinophaga ginsengisegetis]MDR6648379.1 hypothetical protein [Chitinophaga ginsengisegetis]MDR6654471.1 hypothetical protein [Chitinophaga ginsengisegetis]
MKRLHIYFLGLITALFYACSPYEDRITPANPAGIQLDFSVTQNPDYDNQVTLESKTKDVIPFWDYGFGTTKEAKAVVILPFAGDFFVKYSAYGAGGPKTDSVKVTVSENDPKFFSSKLYNLLTNGADGKTWVWAVDVPGGYCFGNGPGNSDVPAWWTVGKAGLITQGVVDDEMTFDLNKNANYSITHKGVTTKGSFTLDTLAQKIKINGADISWGNNVTYNIVKLNANELTLVQQGDGWRNIWIFKRKGFVF